MADFVHSVNVKSATRTLAYPIVDVATLNMIVQSVINDNSRWSLTSAITKGSIHTNIRMYWITSCKVKLTPM